MSKFRQKKHEKKIEKKKKQKQINRRAWLRLVRFFDFIPRHSFGFDLFSEAIVFFFFVINKKKKLNIKVGFDYLK